MLDDLPKDLFKVITPLGATLSDFELSTHGIHSCRDEEGRDMNAFNHPTTSYQNAASIVGMYDRGFRIEMTSAKDVYRLYKLLNNFLDGAGGTGCYYTTYLNSPSRNEDGHELIREFMDEVLSGNRLGLTTQHEEDNNVDYGVRRKRRYRDIKAEEL